LEFLKLTRDYAINPRKQGFRLAGTQHHTWLEESAKKLNVLSEVTLNRRNHTGRSDELEECDGGYVLTDFKLWGSWKVAKSIGLIQTGLAPDPIGERYKREGKYGNRGDIKKVPVFGIDLNQRDSFDSRLQLSDYAIGREELGYPIAKMRIQATIRDNNTTVAVGRGFPRDGDDTIMIPVERLGSDFVEGYFAKKSAQFLEALALYGDDKSYMPTPCSIQENWGGTRCKRFCNLVEFCPEGLRIKGVRQ